MEMLTATASGDGNRDMKAGWEESATLERGTRHVYLSNGSGGCNMGAGLQNTQRVLKGRTVLGATLH